MRIDWEVTTQPTEEPVTLADMKTHLRVDNNNDDALIVGLIAAAREWCEGIQGRAYFTQTMTVSLDSFVDCLDMPRPPLQSISSITYVDSNGDTQTLSSTYYTVDTRSEPGRVYLAYDQTWPTHRDVRHAITITAVCGYDSIDKVPDRIKAAIKLLAAHWYENREAVTSISLKETPRAVMSLLGIDRMHEL